MRRVFWLVAIGCAAVGEFGHAHEVRPAYLEIRQTGPETYDVEWKVPAMGDDLRLGIYVRLPDDAEQLTEPHGMIANGAYLERWTARRPGGLDNQEIAIDGLSSTKVDVLVRVERLDGGSQTVRLLPDSPAFVIEPSPSALDVAGTYLRVGIEHIMLGYDHLLFAMALILLVRGWKRLVGTVTAFTVAHSITLALAVLGYVRFPVPPVEACIALSVAFVAAEIIRSREVRPGLGERAPWVVAFAFGLLHGLGFAGALTVVGLPQPAIPLALLFFNIGVEIAQLAFFVVVLGLFDVARRLPIPRYEWGWRVVPYAIGSVAMFWVVERTAGFFS